jgi:hypothetical protein
MDFSEKYAEECEILHETIQRVRQVQKLLGVRLSIGNPGNEDELKETSVRDELDTLIKNIPEVWVVGEQSAGKSTLVNCLIGFSIMPSDSTIGRTEQAMITCRPTRFTTVRKKGHLGPPRIELKFYDLKAERSKVDELNTCKYDAEESSHTMLFKSLFKPLDPKGISLHDRLRQLHDPQSVIDWASARYDDESRSASLDVQDIEKLTVTIDLILPADVSSTSDQKRLEYVSFVDIPGLMLGTGTNLRFDRILSRLFNEIFEFAKRDACDEKFKQNKCMIETIPCNKDDMTNSFTGGQEEAFPGHRVFTKFDDLEVEERRHQRFNLRSALQISCTGSMFVVGHLNDEEHWEGYQRGDRPRWTLEDDFQEEFDKHDVQFGLYSLMNVVFPQLKQKVIQFSQSIRAKRANISEALTKKQTLNFAMYPYMSQFYDQFSETTLRPVGIDKIETSKLSKLTTYGLPAGKEACDYFFVRMCQLLRVAGEDALPEEGATPLQFHKYLNYCTRIAAIPRLEDIRIKRMLPVEIFIDKTVKSLNQRCNNSIMILRTSCELIETSELSITDVPCAPFMESLFQYCQDDVSKNVLQKDVRILEVCQSFWKLKNQHSYSSERPHLRSEPRDQSSAFRTPLTSFARSMLEAFQKNLSLAFDAIGESLKKQLPVYQHLCTCFKNVTLHALFDDDQNGYWNDLALTTDKLADTQKGWPARFWTTQCLPSPELSYNDIERFLTKEFSVDPVLSEEEQKTQAEVEKCSKALHAMKQEADKRLSVLQHFASSEPLKKAGIQITSLERGSGQRISSAWVQFLDAARVKCPPAESEPLFLSKKLHANIMRISVGNEDEIYWTKTDGGYAGSETLEVPRLLYLIRLVCEGADSQPTVHNVYKSLPELSHFYQRSQMLQKRPDFGRRNMYALLQDEAFKKGSQYFRLDFLKNASTFLSDFFVEIGRLILEAQPDEKLLFIEEVEDFLLKQHEARSENIRKESIECSLAGVSASLSQDNFLGEASKLLFEQALVCSVETQIRVSGLRSDGQLLKDMKSWRDKALELCEFNGVEDTQQIVMAAASIERAKNALSTRESFAFFKHICTKDHELRQKFDSLCDGWEGRAGCPMLASQKAQMAVVCFIIEENANAKFKAAVARINRTSLEFFNHLTVIIRERFLQEEGQGCWYRSVMEPVLAKSRRFQPDEPFVPMSEEFTHRQLGLFFGNVAECHQKQCANSCNLNELISEFL